MVTQRSQTPFTGRSAGIKEYLKHAFLYRWNLLLFLGGVGAAALSPFPLDATLPLVAAAEAAYLGGLISSAKFRSAIDAQAHKTEQESKAAPTRESGRSIGDILASLPVESRTRFEHVRGRCLEMRSIANEVRGRTGAPAAPGEDMSTPALDRLLWVFLRLLISQEALGRFLKRTDPEDIRTRLGEARQKLEFAAGDERLVRSLQDSVAAHEQRLSNYEHAKKNSVFVQVEIDRIEAKIHALTESSINRQDPNFLTSQIDSVAESMQSTEKAISELQQITGIVDEMQEPPAILETDVGRITTS